MRPSDHLVSLCQADWDAATDHVFCKELADGSLPLAKMKWYLAQDYQFIDEFVRLLATMIAHSPSINDSVPAAQFLAVITGPENTYFLRSFEALDVTAEEQNVPVAPDTKAFQALMAKARMSGRYEQMLAVLVVAEWSYLTWATRYNPPKQDLPFWFAEWIELHAGPGFEDVVEYLRTQLDTCWTGLDEDQRKVAADMFIEAVRLERAFFDAAYEDRS